jgi:hypothetical protein
MIAAAAAEAADAAAEAADAAAEFVPRIHLAEELFERVARTLTSDAAERKQR